MANPTTEDDTPKADEYLSTDENFGMVNCNLDGGANDDDVDAADVDAADVNVNEDLGSDENFSSDEGYGTGFMPDDLTYDGASRKSRQILDGIEQIRQRVLEADYAAKSLKRKAARCDSVAKEAKAMRIKCDQALKNMSVRSEDETRQLRCELNQKRDYDAIKAGREVIKEAHKSLRRESDEAKAQLQKELNEKTRDCTALEKQVAELQRKLDVEASFSAQVMAMFSTKPGI